MLDDLYEGMLGFNTSMAEGSSHLALGFIELSSL